MDTLFKKVMAFDDSELERIEKEEVELIKRLSAKKLHGLDNVAQDREGRLYALEDLAVGDDIVMRGELYAKVSTSARRGEKIEL